MSVCGCTSVHSVCVCVYLSGRDYSVVHFGWVIDAELCKQNVSLQVPLPWTRGVSPVCCPVSFSLILFENIVLWFWIGSTVYGHTPLVLDFMMGRECFCNTKSEHCRKKTARDNAQHGTVQELNFPAVTVEDVKFKRQNNSYQVCCWASEVIK